MSQPFTGNPAHGAKVTRNTTYLGPDAFRK